MSPCPTFHPHLSPPFRAEHIGSLLRPTALFEKRALFERNLCSAEDLRVAEDDAIRHVVALQRSAGMRTITDGELRRYTSFQDQRHDSDAESFNHDVQGRRAVPMSLTRTHNITPSQQYIPHIRLMYNAGVKEAETIFCTAKIRRTKSFYVEDFKYLKSLVPAEDVKHIKITMCSPSWYHQRHGSDMTYDLSVYTSDEEYFDDLGTVYRAEIQELYDNGCRHIQIDDPTFCYFCSERMISSMEEAGVDHEALLDTYIRAINGGVHFSEGGYARIAAKIFRTLDVDTFYLEYDTERAGDFAPLKYLPLNKVVVLGLVTTKNTKLETVEELIVRVNEAAEALMKGKPRRCREIALRQLCISTQCGFASVWEGNPVDEEDQRKKFAVLTAAAKRIWG
ncbi:hypothetical protein DXG03_002767 [Asterophora parasitica]|uniref:Cobalamin-independent methionine synthase MetE C-terminal/archaeal domain-containing protein n=1 Tax=Asterophora parasitica TaxID=117018 RepID=A0A9P7G860_9AGAR|nr:hypothetical protein DXG03_002767 [Asterophora parasitica]